jgi:hypothetical protein
VESFFGGRVGFRFAGAVEQEHLVCRGDDVFDLAAGHCSTPQLGHCLADKVLCMTEPSVTTISHRFLGSMRRLTIAPGLAWDLTQQEAWTLARALIAVGTDHSRAEEIFLSPQGCDHEFFARVTNEGLVVTAAGGPVVVGWPDVATLAEALSY